MTSVYVPSSLRSHVGGQSTLDLPGSTVAEVLDALLERYPALRPHLFQEDGAWRSFVHVFVNSEDMRHLQQERTPVGDRDEISIVLPVAGGQGSAVASDRTEERIRYCRQSILPEVGAAGQAKLKGASVLLVGLGGLGSPVALYLAAAGVGRLGLVDFDAVDLSNLHRQVIHRTERVGTAKIVSARETILGVNPLVDVVMHPAALDAGNALEILEPYDVVVDGADNFATRYLVNDACVLLGKPDVSGSVFRFEGQAGVFWARRGPCYRCLYPTPPPPGVMPSCGEAGVLGVLPGMIGMVQATEVIKLILGVGDPLVGRLLLYDALAMSMRELRVRKDPDCPVCGDHPSIRALEDSKEQGCGVDGAGSSEDDEIGALELQRKMAEGSVFVLDVRQPEEWDIARIPDATLIPLDLLPARLEEVPKDRGVVVYCLSGVRSRRAMDLLRSSGYAEVRNLRDGIRAWREAVDPSMPKY